MICRLAPDAAKASLRAQKLKVMLYSPAQITTMARELIAQGPELIAAAKADFLASDCLENNRSLNSRAVTGTVSHG
jgi:hypothetical protein